MLQYVERFFAKEVTVKVSIFFAGLDSQNEHIIIKLILIYLVLESSPAE
jgi:hypothetical protein